MIKYKYLGQIVDLGKEFFLNKIDLNECIDDSFLKDIKNKINEIKDEYKLSEELIEQLSESIYDEFEHYFWGERLDFTNTLTNYIRKNLSQEELYEMKCDDNNEEETTFYSIRSQIQDMFYVYHYKDQDGNIKFDLDDCTGYSVDYWIDLEKVEYFIDDSEYFSNLEQPIDNNQDWERFLYFSTMPYSDDLKNDLLNDLNKVCDKFIDSVQKNKLKIKTSTNNNLKMR